MNISPSQQPVYFYLPDDVQIKQILKADPDKDWELFNNGVRVWVGQTFLRLRQAGFPVELTSCVPRSGILFTHADYVPHVMLKKGLISSLFIVSARADRPRQPYADLEIVQNGHSSDGVRTLHIHHWPQPGLIPRDCSRKETVSNIVYKGMVGEMSDEFNSSQWNDFLAQQDLAWHCDATTWKGNETGAYRDVKWNDYSDADVIVAIRKNVDSLHPKKPASKLINAWTAGVPAILGAEHAYRELRKSELDYIEATTAAETKKAILSLRENPRLYRAMVDNGLKRSQEFTSVQIRQQWTDVIFGEVSRQAALRKRSLFGKSTSKALKFHLGRLLKNQNAGLA
jgi:hypothetical protein